MTDRSTGSSHAGFPDVCFPVAGSPDAGCSDAGSPDSDVRVEACPGGPLLVRGLVAWTDRNGVEHPVTRPVVAVCRCDRSRRQPWCDGTHKFVTADAPARTDG